MSLKKYESPIDQQILPHLNEPVLIVHANGRILQANPAALTLLGLQNAVGQLITNYLDFAELKKKRINHLMMEQKSAVKQLLEVKSFRSSQYTYCLLLQRLSLYDKKAEMKKYIQDIGPSSTEGILIYDYNNTIIDADDTLLAMFGYSHEEIVHKKITELIDKTSINSQSKNPCQFRGFKKDGTVFHIEVFEHPYNNQGNIVQVAAVRDISERVQNEMRIEYIAYYDELTDLPNRNFFQHMLKVALEEAELKDEKLAVYFIDLDYFKEINDTLGYAFGDKLLKANADRLKTLLQTDTFIARMGGDEFLLLKRNIKDKDAAIDYAETIFAAFEKPIVIGEYDMFTSLSIGISLYPEHGTTPDHLIKHADSAMYVIKEKHRNHYKLFESSISENFRMMLTMEAELRRALKKGQFELYYQPQKNLLTGQVVGMEALLRWNHPKRGMVSPAEFIPLAEKTGLIIDIGDWVLYEACRQNKTWQDEGYHPIVVSVNLSARQFHQRGLVDKVKTTLAKTGLAPEYLELEITESMAMTNEEYILETMEQLRQLGVYVSIDDFGTGYSSLKYLSLFPITKLKIDKMFMDERRKQNKAIVKSIIHMSHALDMKVIAEGVETAEQLTFLEKEKCDEIQGFYVSKPLPSHQLSKWLKTIS